MELSLFEAVVLVLISGSVASWVVWDASKTERKTRSQGRSLDEMQKGRAG